MDIWTLAYVIPYAVAAAFYLGVHLGLGARAARLGRAVLVAGWAVQLVEIGVRCFRGQHPLSSTAEAIAFTAWMVAGGFLLASLRYGLQAAGAFAVPVVLVMAVLARGAPQQESAAGLGSALGTTHILLATIGIAIFALAAVLALVYLVQERRLKRKRFARMAERGAPLDTLDNLAARCVSIGFPVLTLTIVTGAVWLSRLGLLQGAVRVKPEYVLTLIAWLAFATLLLARVGAGWRGRRAAWLTLGGFGAATLVLAFYFVRHVA